MLDTARKHSELATPSTSAPPPCIVMRVPPHLECLQAHDEGDDGCVHQAEVRAQDVGALRVDALLQPLQTLPQGCGCRLRQVTRQGWVGAWGRYLVVCTTLALQRYYSAGLCHMAGKQVDSIPTLQTAAGLLSVHPKQAPRLLARHTLLPSTTILGAQYAICALTLIDSSSFANMSLPKCGATLAPYWSISSLACARP